MQISVRVYLMGAFAITAAAPLIVFWLWPYSGILSQKYEEVWERHLLLAENLGAAMDAYHRDLISTMESFAVPISVGMGNEAQPIFENLHFRHLCVADRETGEVVRSYLTEKHACPAIVPAGRLAEFQTLAQENKVGVSSVVAPQNELPRIFLVTEVGDVLVVGAVHTDFFVNLQRRISFGRLGHAAIIDSMGRVLAHPRDDWVATARDISDIAPVARMLAGETGVEIFFSPALELEMIAGFTSLPASGWGVMVPQPTNELDEIAAGFNRDALIILSLGLMFSFALAALASRFLSRRIGNIETQVSAFGQEKGDRAMSFPKDRFALQELRWLERGVERMVQSIHRSKAEVEQRNEALKRSNELLRREIDERQIAERERAASKIQFDTLFEDVPVAIRVEDLSGVAKAVQELNIAGSDEMRRYLDDTPDFVTDCAKAIIVIDANRAAQELHGYSSKEKMLSRVVKHLSEDSRKIVKRTLLAIHAGQRRMDYELTVYPQSGEARRVSSAWSVTPGHEEDYSRILLTSVDITDAIKAEEKLQRAQKMEAVGQLTGGVAHDFNNLLTVIGGHVDLIQEDPANAHDYIPPVLRAVRQGADLTQQLLAFSRKQPLAPKTINIMRLLSDIAEMLRRTLGENFDISFEHDPNLWNVNADPTQVQNALLNLGLNARDAMPNGGCMRISSHNTHLSANESEDLLEGDYVRISVQDSGTGMSEKVQAHAFEPFFSTREVGEGSGLGLSMVYGFAKQSNGHVEISSKQGKGTTVSIFLPRDHASAPADVDCGSERWANRGNGTKVLVLEDQPDVRRYLVRALQQAEYVPVAAANARTAQTVLDAHPDLHVAVCDILLPDGVSGIDFATAAKKLRPGLKVVFLSGNPPQADRALDPSLSDCVILQKPIETRQLLAVLQSLRFG